MQDKVTFSTVGVDTEGIVDPEEVAAACRPETCLVSVMHCNNEIGSVQPISEISRAVRAVSGTIMIHTDAAQSFGKVPVDVEAMGVDMATFVGHKIGAPKVRCNWLSHGRPLFLHLMWHCYCYYHEREKKQR